MVRSRPTDDETDPPFRRMLARGEVSTSQDQASRAGQTRTVETDRHKPITILVVEDQASLRDMVARALGDDGYAVITAATGKEAFDILLRHKERIDWLFTDVRLPGRIDGWRVAEEFRFAHPFRPVVYATTEGVNSARMVPGSIFFHKPYRPSEIVAAFKGLSDRHPDGIDMNGVDLVMPPGVAAGRAPGSSAEPKRGRPG